eukprot:scaffold8867_cov118-Isochrysis_galbana.AAC.9
MWAVQVTIGVPSSRQELRSREEHRATRAGELCVPLRRVVEKHAIPDLHPAASPATPRPFCGGPASTFVQVAPNHCDAAVPGSKTVMRDGGLHSHLDAALHEQIDAPRALRHCTRAVNHALLKVEQEARATRICRSTDLPSALRRALLKRSVHKPEELKCDVGRHLAHCQHELLQVLCLGHFIGDVDKEMRKLWQQEFDLLERARLLCEVNQTIGRCADRAGHAPVLPKVQKLRLHGGRHAKARRGNRTSFVPVPRSRGPSQK